MAEIIQIETININSDNNNGKEMEIKNIIGSISEILSNAIIRLYTKKNNKQNTSTDTETNINKCISNTNNNDKDIDNHKRLKELRPSLYA